MATRDIWAGVNFGNNIVNPGSVFETYNPNTGQTTYGTPPSGYQESIVGTGQSVVTPSNTPANAYVAGRTGGFATYGSGANNVSESQYRAEQADIAKKLAALRVGESLSSNYTPTVTPQTINIESPERKIGDQSSVLGKKTTETASLASNLSLKNLLADKRVSADKTMTQWLAKNAALLPKLASLGYTTNDMINEAYAQTRYNKSAFSGDMTAMPAEQNRTQTKTAGYSPKTEAEGEKSTLSTEQKAQLTELNSYIDGLTNPDGSPFTDAQKAILKQIASEDYTSGQAIPTAQELNKIIENAAANATTNISPYYEKMTSRELEDLKNEMADIRNEAARYAQSEAATYKSKLAEAKKSLRARGLTFSGVSRGELGAETASAEGAMGIEGSLPQARRYDWEDKLAQWQELARDIGTTAERQLGSAYLSSQDLGRIISPYQSGTTYQAGATIPAYLAHEQGATGYVSSGDLELARLKAIEEAKWSNVAKYAANQ